MRRPSALLALLITTAAWAQQPATTQHLTPSDELNKTLPKWLRFSGEFRGRLEGFTGGVFQPNNDDLYFLSRFRLNLGVQPSSWLKFRFQAQDARVGGKNQNPAAPPYQDTLDLRLAYVELGDSEKKSVGLRVGRQELAFGEERLLGNVNWLNTARSFDAVRATVRHGRYKLDAFASAVVVQRDGEFDRRQAGNNLHGLYGSIENPVPHSTLEPYVFWRLSPRLLTESRTTGNLDSKTIGVRWVGKLPLNFDYGAEVAGQTGSLASDRIRAWAGHWLTGYTIKRARYQPRLTAEYNYASGDKDSRDGRRGTFDQLYPTPHDKYGLADQVGWKNIHHARAGIESKVRPKWLLSSRYSSWWLASSRDALYGAGGAVVARSADGSAGRHVGQEIDWQAMYSMSGQAQIAGGFAHVFPGEFLKHTTPGKSFNYPYLSVNYIF